MMNLIALAPRACEVANDCLSFWDVITMSITAWLLLLAVVKLIHLFERR